MAVATADALLGAAEVAFALRGIGSGSLRSIMRAAGANPAAVHYHYGSREQLVRAVLDRILQPLQQRRLRRLAEYVAWLRDDAPTVEGLLTCLVAPDFEAVGELAVRNPAATRLLGTLYTDPSRLARREVERRFAPVAERFTPQFLRALPHLAKGELAWRVRWCVFGTLGALLSDAALEPDTRVADTHLPRLLVAMAGALRAPVAQTTTPQPRSEDADDRGCRCH